MDVGLEKKAIDALDKKVSELREMAESLEAVRADDEYKATMLQCAFQLSHVSSMIKGQLKERVNSKKK